MTLVLVSLGLLGCAPELELDDELAVRASPEEITALQDASCVEGRRVARIQGAEPTCPTAPGWKSTKLFADGTGELANYCVYEYVNAGPVNLQPLDALTDAHDADCEVVFPQSGDPLSLAISTELQAAFHGAINRASADDLDLGVNEELRSDVTVAIVDTIPNPAPADPSSPHGESMAAFVRDIACPALGGSCAVDVRNALGMPRVEGRTTDLVNGGRYGSQADLARAIHKVVTNAPGGSPLVVNLSLGWEAELFGDQVASSVPVEAVHAALEHARCRGALVVAAAGNQGHLCTSGPLMPGGWEVEAAPTPPRCAEIGVANPAPLGAGYSPLVYAVGGLDYDAEAMPATRVGGMPRLAATAMHAISDVSDPRTALSGSSVSAAVVSGAASLIWSFYPQLSADQVMNTIYAGAAVLGPQANFIGPNAASARVRRVDVCAAVHMARQRPDTAYLPAPLDCLTEPPALIDDVFPIVAGVDSAPVEPVLEESPSECSAGCVAGEAFVSAAVKGEACPTPIEPALPFTTPQPTHPACPSCTVDTGTAEIYAALDVDYARIPIQDVMVTVNGPTAPTHFRLGPVELSDTTTTLIRLDPARMPTVIDSATITITFDDASLPRPNESDLIVGP
ncbi:S8/S53 family peptidase [Enhygromyxa salina]|uniref:S8/S53 family peptidase n=1 Tax=Enhygromyxa salina TaxID=215803 RepID=UPI0015E5D601|nr:S8/S53 family peptidase [Enhygromyxa salina]